MALAINIEPASPIAIHRQIYEAWRRGILSGRFAAGDRLPSTRELAVTLAVSRSTVSQAYEQLISEGYLQAARGSGTFVCRELPDRSLHAQVAVKLTPHRAAPPPLSRYGSGLSDDYPHEPCRAGFVCFSQWGPDLVQFPWMLWRRTLSRHLRQTRHDVFDYAQQVEGYEPLRREIAAYVSRSRAVNCTPSQVIVVNGSQQGLDLCGLICGDLGRGARVVYVTPSHQYPTGVAMSLNRRLELLAWARRQSAVIIEDDYDSEYRYSGSPLPALQGLAQEVPVVYCGTFSKVMFPSLRIGYLIVPDARQALGGQLHTDIGADCTARLHRRRAPGAAYPAHAPLVRQPSRSTSGSLEAPLRRVRHGTWRGGRDARLRADRRQGFA